MFGWRSYGFPDVFEEMARMRRQWDRLLSELDDLRAPTGLFPPLNIYDDGESFVVRAEIPGVDPKDLEVSATQNSITIRGERKPLDIGDKASFHRRERDFGQFSRSVSLPQPVNADKIRASYELGVLEIVLPKSDEARPRKVKIG